MISLQGQLYLTLKEPNILDSSMLAALKRNPGLPRPETDSQRLGVGTYHGFTTASPRFQGRAARILRETLRSPNTNEGNTRAASTLAPGNRMCVRLSEVLLRQASAELR